MMARIKTRKKVKKTSNKIVQISQRARDSKAS